MPRVIHFEINADNTERAIKFYTKVFGWKIEKAGPMDYWLATTGPDSEPGINGAIMPREGKNAVINTIGVASFDAAAKKIKAGGGKVPQPKTAIQGVGWYAYCQDTEGNVFGIMENDPNAK